MLLLLMMMMMTIDDNNDDDDDDDDDKNDSAMANDIVVLYRLHDQQDIIRVQTTFSWAVMQMTMI